MRMHVHVHVHASIHVRTVLHVHACLDLRGPGDVSVVHMHVHMHGVHACASPDSVIEFEYDADRGVLTRMHMYGHACTYARER